MAIIRCFWGTNNWGTWTHRFKPINIPFITLNLTKGMFKHCKIRGPGKEWGYEQLQRISETNPDCNCAIWPHKKGKGIVLKRVCKGSLPHWRTILDWRWLPVIELQVLHSPSQPMYICDYANADIWPFFGVALSPSVFPYIKCVCGSAIKFSELFLSSVVR